MSDNIFPSSISSENVEKLYMLGEKVLNKPRKEFTKEEILLLLQMDMKTILSKLVVSAAATRPTNIKYATNNYHISMDIDISGIFEVVNTFLATVPEDKLIDQYFAKKNLVYNLIRFKYESSERYLRSLLDLSIKKDGCVTVGSPDE